MLIAPEGYFLGQDFTFVCPTEIIAFSDRAKEFEELNCQLIAASTDTEVRSLVLVCITFRSYNLQNFYVQVRMLVLSSPHIFHHACPNILLSLTQMRSLVRPGLTFSAMLHTFAKAREVSTRA